jgi:serine O-acetyltransferase
MFGVRHFLALPALIALRVTDRKEIVEADLRRWTELEGRSNDPRRALLELIAERKEFRTLFYHRLYHGNVLGKLIARACFLLLPRQQLLFLSCEDIGPGLYLQHAWATGIAAEHIGANVWIQQLVTVGFALDETGTPRSPVIEDGVTICSGARVIGNVRVGRNAVIGANAVVTKDVPDGMVAVGVPAVPREPSAKFSLADGPGTEGARDSLSQPG